MFSGGSSGFRFGFGAPDQDGGDSGAAGVNAVSRNDMVEEVDGIREGRSEFGRVFGDDEPIPSTLHIVGETIKLPIFTPTSTSTATSTSPNPSFQSLFQLATKKQHDEKVTVYRRSLSDVKFVVASGEDEGEKIGEVAWLERVVHGNEDVVDGVYEGEFGFGGFKTWECSLDLVSYLSSLSTSVYSFFGPGRRLRVLELGCGSALPGIYCLTKGSYVDFQDYNDHVIRLLTLPNAALNLSAKVTASGDLPFAPDRKGMFEVDLEDVPALLRDEGATGVDVRNQCGFLKGDWGGQVLDGEAYDVVLTSETIYSKESQASLYKAIETCLARPHGVALIAAKTSYFGCSGTLLDFLDLVESKGTMNAETVFEEKEGVARRIVKITFK
ncbi:hypothetical protein HDU97_010195 [Phlyctochytrium planicorne]|nr:hypothetical protein HDU97_010195 [Phlyctochytrium planicorne]